MEAFPFNFLFGLPLRVRMCMRMQAFLIFIIWAAVRMCMRMRGPDYQANRGVARLVISATSRALNFAHPTWPHG